MPCGTPCALPAYRLCAVGPGTGDCAAGSEIERVYAAFRALSMDAVTVSVSRDSASTFDVNFRLLPANNGSYGRIIDRTYVATGPALLLLGKTSTQTSAPKVD